MTPFRDWPTFQFPLLGALVLAAGWFGVAGIRAAHLAPLPPIGLHTSVPTAYPHSHPDFAPQDPLVLAAIRRHPMRPDRSRPPSRFSADVDGEPNMEAPSRDPIPEFRVVGVVRHGRGRGIAAIATDRAPTLLLRVGESVAGFRLLRIRADSVLLTRADTAVAVPVPGAIQRRGD